MKTQSFGKLVLDTQVYPSMFNDQVKSFRVSQEVVTTYANSSQDIFGKVITTNESTYTSVRSAFIKTGVDSTPEYITESLSKHPKAKIQRFLDFKPMISPEQQLMLDQGRLQGGIEALAEKQLVKNAEGEVVTRNGKPLYRVHILSLTGEADVDFTTEVVNTPEEAALVAKEVF